MFEDFSPEILSDAYTETLPEDEWVGDVLGDADDYIGQLIEGDKM
jgi:hypothetical protein